MDPAATCSVVAALKKVIRPRVWATSAVVLFVAQLALFRGYVTDDTWIYARFAEVLAQTGQLAFWPREPIHAATSPVWAAMAALGAKLGISPIDSLMGMARICGVVSVLVFVRCARRLLGETMLAAAAVAAFATEIWFVRWSASGMETAAAVLWLLLVFESSFRRPASDRAGVLGLLLGLGFLLRPEAALLGAMLGVARILDAPPRARGRIVAGALLAPVLWAVHAWPVYGHLLPATLQAKSTPLGLEFDRLAANARVLVTLVLLAIPVVAGLWWPTLFGRVRAWARRDFRWGWTELAWWGWSVALPLAYLLRDVQLISRYLEILLPVLPLLVLTSLSDRQGRGAARWRRWTAGALLAQSVVALVLTVGWVAPRSRDFGRSLEAGLGDLADWIRENTEPDELVAVYDIGYLGAHCERRILDLGGLVHPGINDLRNRIDDGEILRRGLFLEFGEPAVLIDRDARADALDGWRLPGFRLEAVLHREVANLGLSRPEPVVYTLYRLVPGDF